MNDITAKIYDIIKEFDPTVTINGYDLMFYIEFAWAKVHIIHFENNVVQISDEFNVYYEYIEKLKDLIDKEYRVQL